MVKRWAFDKHLNRMIEVDEGTKSNTYVLYSDCAALRALLAEAQMAVCATSCPSTWKTGEPQPHCDLCNKIKEAIK